MDKYEYQVCTEQIKSLIAEKRFAEAMDIADTIDWRRVRSVSMLCTVSEIYKINKHYEDSRDILLLAYEQHPKGRDIVYALCELAIKLEDIVQAIECYKEFVALAPDDADGFVLLYKIYKAQDVSLEEQIDVLEELKRKEYREKWAYELAYLYHLTGQETKCIAECDELALWFGEGKFVRKAMELKMKHTKLTKEQQARYEGREATGQMPVFNQPYADGQFGNNAAMTGPMMDQYGEYIQQTGQITGQITGQMYSQATGPMSEPVMDSYGNMYQQDMYGNMVQIDPSQYGMNQQIQVTPGMNHLGMTQDIIIQPTDDNRWSTMDLQEHLGNQVKEVLAMNVDGTQPITYENNQEMYNAAQVEYTSPQLFEEKYAQESENPIGEVKVEESASPKVHTGVIDLSGVQLPPTDETPIEVASNIPEKEVVFESVEKRSIEETGDIMSRLQGVIPGTAPMTKESAEVERIAGTTAAANTVKGISAIQGLPDELDSIGANGSVINKPQTKSSVTGAIPSFLPSKKEVQDEDEDEIVNETVATEPVEEKSPFLPAAEEKEITIPETEQENMEEPAEEIEEEPVETTNEEVEAVNEEPAEETPVEPRGKNYPYDTVTDIGYVEELPELDQPDDIDDMLATKDLPTHEIEEEAKKAYETDALPEIEEYEVDEVDEEDEESSDGNIYNRMKKDVRSKREFDDDEFRIFCRYDGIEALKAQLVDAMDVMSMEGNHGNIIVMGPENTDRKEIAINIVKVLKDKNPIFSGKVAKISGEALNKKNIKATLSKLENGALIVENAGGLTAETVLLITSTLSEESQSVLVVLEDTKENIKPLFKATKLLKTVFDARVDIDEFSNNDLVAYGRGYALEKEYVIDEMGTLALYNRVGELQTYDHKVTIEEVKELIETAIRHVDKKSVSHFMDMLLGKRYDDEDYIILKEKDFNF